MRSKLFLFYMLTVLLLADRVQAQVSENMNVIGRWGLGTCKTASVYGSGSDSYLVMGNGATLEISEVRGSRPFLVKVGKILLPDVISDIYLAWPKAYVACEDYGLVIVDLSTPSNPIQRGTFNTDGNAVAIHVYGDYAYVADGTGGMVILNVSSSLSPYRTSVFQIEGSAVWDVWADDNIVYAADGSTGFWTVNVSNKYQPVLLDSVHVSGSIQSIYIQRFTAYLACGDAGLKQVDITNPSSLSLIGTWKPAGSINFSDVFVRTTTAYLTDSNFGVRVLNLTNPLNPGVISSLATRGNAYGITLNPSSSAFVADGGAGMLLLDVSGATPLRVDSLSTGDVSQDVLIYRNWVYVAGGKSGLWILNRSQASTLSMEQAGRITGFRDCQALVRKDTLLFAADGSAGIKTFNIKNPTSPVLLSTKSVQNFAADVDVFGNQIVVADGTAGLHLFGISNPRELTDLGIIPLGSGTARKVKVDARRNQAYASVSTGTRIVDLQNKVVLGTCPGSTDAFASDFSTSGDTLYVADGDNGVMAFNIRNATVPQLLSGKQYSTPGTASDILVKGNAAIVADGDGTVRIVDLTGTPREVGYYHSAGFSMGLALSRDTLAVADGEAGIYLFKGNFAGTLASNRNNLDFAGVVIGKKRIVSVELSNTGTSPVLVRSVTSSSGRFVSESGLPFSIFPGDKANLLTAFVPAASGLITDVLVIESDANNSPIRINVRGTGVQAVPLETYMPDYFTFLLYHMTSTVRDTILPDESLYGYLDGALYGGAALSSPDSGRFGRALVLNSEEAKVRVRADSISFLPEFQGFTVDTWFKLTKSQKGRKNIFRIFQGSKVLFALGVDDLENQRVLAAMSVRGPQDTLKLKAGTDYGLSLYKWYHAALVFNGSAMKLYLNGTRVDSISASINEDKNNPISMMIGYTNQAGSIVGYLDEFRLSGAAREPWEFNVSTGRIASSPSSLNFGNVLLSNTRTLSIWVQNTGAGTLWIDSVKTSNARYSVSPKSLTLASGASGTIYVAFSPLTAGITGGVVQIYSRDPHNPLKNVLVTGNGYSKGAAGPYSTDYYTAGLWHCEGVSGDTILADASSYNLRGTFRGPGINWDRSIYRWGSSSLYFNGGSGWARIPYNPILNFNATPFTVEMWFRMGAKPQSGYWSILRRGWGSNAQFEILYGDSLETGKGLSARLFSSSGQSLVLRGAPDTEMHVGSWYHLAVTWDQNKLRLFLNGIQSDSVAFAGTLRVSTADVSVGGSYGKGHGFNGYIDEMRLSNINRQIWEYNLVGPSLRATPNSLTFGQVLLGETSVQDLVLSNFGDQTLAVTGMLTNTASFSVSPTSAQIGMGQSQTVRVTFAPKATGLIEDALKISSNDPNQALLSISLTGTGNNYRSKVPYTADANTVALFHFDETSGAIATDSKTGTGAHNGTLMNGVARITDGYFNGALHLDGKNQYVTVPSADDLIFDMSAKSFTIECFFRTDTISKTVFFKDVSAATDKANYGLSIDNAGKAVAYGFGTANLWVADKAWHHAAFVYDVSTRYGTLYIDGSLLVQQAWTTDKTDTKNPRALVLGAREISAGVFGEFFEGDLDELRISNTARKPWEFLLARSNMDIALPSVPVVGSSQNVHITVPLDTVTKTIALYYRKGGETAYSSVAATSSDKINYRAVVPASAVTFMGMEYYAEKTTSTGKTTQPLYDAVRKPIATAARFTGQTAEITLPAKKYTMISVPADLDRPSVYSVLHDDMGKYDPYTWRCFAFKDTSYAEFADTLAYADSAYFNFTRGRAFWVIPAQAETFNVGAGSTTSLESPYKLTVKPQWNMVGSVFPFPVAWDDCALSSESIGTLYYYDGTGYRLDWPVMDSWRGYWLYNSGVKTQTVYVPPKISAGGKGVPKRGVLKDLADGDWIFRLSARNDQANDLDNFAGVRNSALEELDSYDRQEPPKIGDYITLYVDHSDWTLNAGNYAADIREPGREGYVWNFVMESSLVKQSIVLSWEWKQSLPEGWTAYLIDETEGTAQRVLEAKSLVLQTGGKAPTVRRFKFIAGTPEFVEKTSDVPLVPVEFHLAQNFPNPFNPQTSIQYAIPQNGRVRLAVYNMLGQEVRVLVDEEQKSGIHEVVWDGYDRNSVPATSGVYLYRMESLGRIAIRKLILMK